MAQKKRVLVVDDEPAIRKLLQTILEKEGLEVHQAEDGPKGIEKARAILPDIITLDVSMGGMSGLEACRRLKADPTLKGVPILICTSDSGKMQIIGAIQAGADEYILKPFSADDLAARVRRLLNPKPVAPLHQPPAHDLRRAARAAARWVVSWSPKDIPGFSSAYKCTLLDISTGGMAIEFNRCQVCTGYEQGAVHPKCLFAPVAVGVDGGTTIEFILSLNRDIFIEVQGRIAHVFQSEKTPTIERVGVKFTEVPPEVALVIEEYVAGNLAL